MSQIRRILMPWTTIYADSTSVRNIPAGPWVDAGSIIQVRVTWEFRETTNISLFQVQPGYQVADVADTISSSNSLETLTKAQNVHFPQSFTNVVAVTQARQLFRPIWRASLSGAGNLALGRVAGMMEIELR